MVMVVVVAVNCNALQHTVTYSNILQHTATHTSAQLPNIGGLVVFVVIAVILRALRRECTNQISQKSVPQFVYRANLAAG